MTTLIQSPPLCDLPNVKVQHLPCTIKSNGPINLDEYFKPTENTSKSGNEFLSATFRGRPLEGQDIKVPEGYVGVVVREKRRPFSEDEDRTLNVVGKFEGFTKWHLDSRYTSTSNIENAVNVWPKIAAALHAPVTLDGGIKKETE